MLYNDNTLQPEESKQWLPPAWIAVGETAQLLAAADMPRNSRTIRRYCERGDLECRKTENDLHQPQYFINPDSVFTYIEQQKSLPQSRPDTSGSGRATPVGKATANDDNLPTPDLAQSGYDRSHPSEPAHALSGRNVEFLGQLEARLKDKDAEIDFLRSELLHRRTTDTALHDVIAAFRANAEAQRLTAGSHAGDRHPPAQGGATHQYSEGTRTSPSAHEANGGGRPDFKQ